MNLTEKHQIKPSHPYFEEIDILCFLSKNLYNSVLYILRQQFFEYEKFKKNNKSGKKKFKWLSWQDLCKKFAKENQQDFRALPAKVAQHVIKQVFETFHSFFEACKAYAKDKRKFTGKPKLPKYKDKLGKNICEFDFQSIRKNLQLTNSNIILYPKIKRKIKLVHLVPQSYGYCIEIVYEKEPKKLKANKNVASLDPGLNNLATLTFNKSLSPLIIPGGPVKSINQYYNKKKGKLQSMLPEWQHWSNGLAKLTQKRTNKINDYLHKSSRFIINYLASQRINTLVIGKNAQWKQRINLGKVNNQNFVQAPIARFLDMLKYKAELKGIKVIFTEEAYTSKCSFLDLEEIKKHEIYLGKRLKRGLFQSADGRLINADINGSYNIMRNAIPNITFDQGIEGVVIRPRKVLTSENKIWFISN